MQGNLSEKLGRLDCTLWALNSKKQEPLETTPGWGQHMARQFALRMLFRSPWVRDISQKNGFGKPGLTQIKRLLGEWCLGVDQLLAIFSLANLQCVVFLVVLRLSSELALRYAEVLLG